MVDRNSVYSERNTLVALLSCLYEGAFISPVTDESGWFIVVIPMDTGRNKAIRYHSWHIPEVERYLFKHLDVKDDWVWDGETTQEKYDSIVHHINQFGFNS